MLIPDPRNLSRFVETVYAPDFSYSRSVNPFHIRDGAWSYRGLADRPMNAANYGASSPFKRKDTGLSNIIIHQTKFQDINPPSNEINVQFSQEADPTSFTINDTVGGGTTKILERVLDPAGSQRQVFKMEWDCTKLWAMPDSGAASSPLSTGRRRSELTHTVSALHPFGTELWSITSLYLDPAIDWASMTAGDYFIHFQYKDTNANDGGNPPAMSGSISAKNTTYGGSYTDSPPETHYHFALAGDQGPILRIDIPNLAYGKWMNTIVNARCGGSSPFTKVWLAVDGSPIQQIVDYVGPWGYLGDSGTPYLKSGLYSPSQYTGTVPYRRLWLDGIAQLRSSLVPGMTPERMIAALNEQPGF